MTVNGEITIWTRRLDPNTRQGYYERVYSGACSVQNDVIVSLQNNGLSSANAVKVRVPSDADFDVQCGSRAVLALSDAEAPPNECLEVIGFAKNFRGSRAVRHTKVILR